MTGILGTRIMAALTALFNFLALNLALLVVSLPIVTLPAAVSAATLALDRWRRDGEDQVVREFIIELPGPVVARQTVLVGVPLAAAAARRDRGPALRGAARALPPARRSGSARSRCWSPSTPWAMCSC